MTYETSWHEPGAFPAELHGEFAASSREELRQSEARWDSTLMDLVEILAALWEWIKTVLSFLDETFLK